MNQLTPGSNTDLVYTFGDGWSVEVHGIRLRNSPNEVYAPLFTILNPNKDEVYEGEFAVKPDRFMEPPNFYTALCAIVFALRQDKRRIDRPDR